MDLFSAIYRGAPFVPYENNCRSWAYLVESEWVIMDGNWHHDDGPLNRKIFGSLRTWNATPPKTNMTGWKIHHEWRCQCRLCLLKMVIFQCHVGFRKCCVFRWTPRNNTKVSIEFMIWKTDDGSTRKNNSHHDCEFWIKPGDFSQSDDMLGTRNIHFKIVVKVGWWTKPLLGKWLEITNTIHLKLAVSGFRWLFFMWGMIFHRLKSLN